MSFSDPISKRPPSEKIFSHTSSLYDDELFDILKKFEQFDADISIDHEAVDENSIVSTVKTNEDGLNYCLKIKFEVGGLVIIHLNAEIEVREGVVRQKECRVAYCMCRDLIQNEDDELEMKKLIPSIATENFLLHAYYNHFTVCNNNVLFEKSEMGELVFKSIKKNLIENMY